MGTDHSSNAHLEIDAALDMVKHCAAGSTRADIAAAYTWMMIANRLLLEKARACES